MLLRHMSQTKSRPSRLRLGRYIRAPHRRPHKTKLHHLLGGVQTHRNNRLRRDRTLKITTKRAIGISAQRILQMKVGKAVL